jgi:deoxyadenosine/deoxycytidine kinase
VEGVNFQANGDGRQLVLIEGNIGAGKTTVGNTIADANMFGFIEEPTAVWREGFASNMLELFYSDTERWAFTFQICAFVTRAKTWHEIWQRTDRNRVILERSIYCDRYVFAENCYRTGLFTKAEYQLYCSMWDFMVSQYCDEPDAILY